MKHQIAKESQILKVVIKSFAGQSGDKNAEMCAEKWHEIDEDLQTTRTDGDNLSFGWVNDAAEPSLNRHPLMV